MSMSQSRYRLWDNTLTHKRKPPSMGGWYMEQLYNKRMNSEYNYRAKLQTGVDPWTQEKSRQNTTQTKRDDQLKSNCADKANAAIIVACSTESRVEATKFSTRLNMDVFFSKSNKWLTRQKKLTTVHELTFYVVHQWLRKIVIFYKYVWDYV